MAGHGWRKESREMSEFLLVIHMMLALALIGVVLLQRSEGGGLGQRPSRW